MVDGQERAKSQDGRLGEQAGETRHCLQQHRAAAGIVLRIQHQTSQFLPPLRQAGAKPHRAAAIRIARYRVAELIGAAGYLIGLRHGPARRPLR